MDAFMNQQSPARGLPEHSHPSQPVASASEGLPSPKISFELPAFSLFASGQIGREETERFIDQQFFKSYGAQHSEYMPWLISMRQQGQLSACAGVAFAVDKNPLFLERYLPSSIESLVSKNCGMPITRGQIAEVGNLAGSSFGGEHIGSSRLLYIVLASVLEEIGIEWMVFTATRPLLVSLQRLGLKHCMLGDADESFLDDAERSHWGSYYEHQPRVVAAPLSSANESIRERTQFAAIREHYASTIADMARHLTPPALNGSSLAP
jgi:hypothetical protein